MNKKTLLGSLVLGATLFTGCSSSLDSLNVGLMGWSFMPDSKERIVNNIQIEKDSFKNQTWIKTYQYAIIPEAGTEQFPMRVSYRALIKDEDIKFIQLYFSKSDNSRGFYKEVVGEDGYKFKFTNIGADYSIDSNKMSYSYGKIQTKEDFGILIPYDKLQELSMSDYRLKIYGSHNEGVVKLPSHFASAMIEALKDYAIKNYEQKQKSTTIKVLGAM